MNAKKLAACRARMAEEVEVFFDLPAWMRDVYNPQMVKLTEAAEKLSPTGYYYAALYGMPEYSALALEYNEKTRLAAEQKTCALSSSVGADLAVEEMDEPPYVQLTYNLVETEHLGQCRYFFPDLDTVEECVAAAARLCDKHYKEAVQAWAQVEELPWEEPKADVKADVIAA